MFAFSNLLACLSAAAIWRYLASGGNLLAEDADPRLVNGIALLWAPVALGFLVRIIAGLWSVHAEYVLWLAWSPVVSIWWYHRLRRLGTWWRAA